MSSSKYELPVKYFDHHFKVLIHVHARYMPNHTIHVKIRNTSNVTTLEPQSNQVHPYRIHFLISFSIIHWLVEDIPLRMMQKMQEVPNAVDSEKLGYVLPLINMRI